jgi:2-phospho-L-lactate guanylyltransferase
MKAILLPIKNPDNPKSRLSKLMSLDERQRLAWAMYADVARAIAASRAQVPVVVVTGFEAAKKQALSMGFEVLFEDEQVSESASVDRASRILAGRGFDAVLRLPGDIPLLQPDDVDALLAVDVPSPGALMAPSFEGTGTNALMRTPPDLFPSRFGPNSLALHKEEASRAGARCIIVDNPRIALDIDEPADLNMFLTMSKGTGGEGTETYEITAKQLGDRVIK